MIKKLNISPEGCIMMYQCHDVRLCTLVQFKGSFKVDYSTFFKNLQLGLPLVHVM